MKDETEKLFEEIYEEKKPDFSKTLNMAVIGKVSSGKSSLINAILYRGRDNPVAEVGATSGSTKEVKAFRLDDKVLIVDSPGLNDILEENSKVTENFLINIDVGILVLTGSADKSQKGIYEELKKCSKKVFVVLNKIDEWDDLEDVAREEVFEQWKNLLAVDKIYPTCTIGYDPRLRKDAPMKLIGVDELNDDIRRFLHLEGKDILLARHMDDKRRYAAGIIGAAIVSVAVEAAIPGSAAYITATQTIAITSLYYMYKGEVLSKSAALSLIPRFVGQSLGINVFLWLKSFLPPTGTVDLVAMGVAVTITFAMLSSVNYVLSNNIDFENYETIEEIYKKYLSENRAELGKQVSKIRKGKLNMTEFVYNILFK